MIFDSKNWNFPPTEFNALKFDQNGSLLLLTSEEGLFKLVDDKWQRLFVTDNLRLGFLKDLVVLPANRVAMLTSSGNEGLFSPPKEGEDDGLVLFDPKNNTHEIMRFEWKN